MEIILPISQTKIHVSAERPSIVTKITQLGGERGLNPTYCLFIILLFLPITLVALPIGKFLEGPVVVRNHFGQNEGILGYKGREFQVSILWKR